MNTMTLTAKGQCTFNKQLLDHLGAKPGDKVQVNRLSDGSLKIMANPNPMPLRALRGSLKTELRVSDAEIDSAIRQGYAARGVSGLEELL